MEEVIEQDNSDSIMSKQINLSDIMEPFKFYILFLIGLLGMMFTVLVIWNVLPMLIFVITFESVMIVGCIYFLTQMTSLVHKILCMLSGTIIMSFFGLTVWLFYIYTSWAKC
jgi:hypothetical protein